MRDIALIRLLDPFEDDEVPLTSMARTSPPPAGKGLILGAGPGWQNDLQEISVELGHSTNAKGRWSLTDVRGHGATTVPGFSGSPLFGEYMTVIWGMVQQVGAPGQRTTLISGADRLHEALKLAEVTPNTSVRHFSGLGVTAVQGGLGDDQKTDGALEIKPVNFSTGTRITKKKSDNVKSRVTKRVRCSWALNRLHVPALWTLGLRGEGVRIGDVNTGVNAAHSLLKGRVAAYALFDYDGFLVPDATPKDSGEVGTYTAGLLVGLDEKAQIGVAPNAELYIAQAIDGGNIAAR